MQLLLRRDALLLAALQTVPDLPVAPAAVWPAAVPRATFGVQIYDDETAHRLTLQAVASGFRSFFTSPEAGNQRGFAAAIRECGVPRSQLFVAGSLLCDDADSFAAARRQTAAALAASMRELRAGGVDSLDLLLLERPASSASAIRGQWKGLQEGQTTGALLGVCNFDLPELDVVLRASRDWRGAPPCVNQLPFSLGVRMDHAGMMRAHAARGVGVQAWGPLGGPDALIPKAVLAEADAIGRAQARRRSAYAVALRWVVQQGAGFVVHSRLPSHLQDDLEALEFELTEEEVHIYIYGSICLSLSFSLSLSLSL